MNYQFEKNKLYNYLGQHLVSVFKEQKVFIAGGTISSLFSNREINDIDVYFRNEDSLTEIIEAVWEDSGDWINALTEKALLVRVADTEVQFIHFKYYEKAEDIFESFDYTVCMGAFDFQTEEFILHDDFLKHNSQRILKFNKATDFPVVSLLRVHKYKEKGYNISKPEFLRVALKCMDLKIKTVEELKNHLGGMYGVNYDKLIQLKEGEEFTIDLILDKISDITLSDEYFIEPKKVEFKDIDEVIQRIQKQPVKIVQINENTYRVTRNGTLKEIGYTPKDTIEIEARDFIEGRKFYKFVNKVDGKYMSHWDKEFEYKIDSAAKPKEENYLYFNEKGEILKSFYRNNGVLLEAYIPYDSFHSKNSSYGILTKKAYILREVPKEEYEAWSQD
ncbi:hypothetical protein [Paenibacillus sp. FSL H3-0333]|uniref:hypothetical protein n=1 Tax=Paenibacillus sp. FSL H3-0333 TaxID=2921373 RepID=UPI0030FCA8E9